jgi:hypothetical protein
MNIDRDQLRKQQEETNEWDSNKFKRALQLVLKRDLNNDVYRSKTPKEAAELVENCLREEGVLSEARYLTTANRLLRKLKAAKTVTESVVAIGDCLLK